MNRANNTANHIANHIANQVANTSGNTSGNQSADNIGKSVIFVTLTTLTQCVSFLALGLGIWSMGAVPGARAQSQPNCSVVEQTTSGNTVRQGDTVVLGQSGDRRYVVAIPTGSMDILKVIRLCIPDAFITQSKLGAYIHAGAFTNQDHAESLAAALRSRGFDARVIYAR